LDRLHVICIIAIPKSLPSRLIRFRIVGAWNPFTSQHIVRITDITLRITDTWSRNAQLSSARTLFPVGHRNRS